ncbi:MAG: universal stress protein [Planctomycetes bacterium]|nr:universal stress protein [Planctomycetota bacterium]
MSHDRKHILLTTDLSEESFEAFGPVAELARAFGAKVTLLYVLPSIDHHPTGSPFISPVPIPSDAEQLERARRDLEQVRPRFASDIEVETDACTGEEIPLEILQYAQAKQVDIIALSTHARRGLSRLVMGSIAEEVIRHATVPCYVVPQHRH